MTWIRLDDKAPRHPKIIDLSDAAFRWWVQGLCYASEFLTDGVLPATFARGVPDEVRQELLSARLWDHLDGGKLCIHDYLEHQESRESVLTERARNKARARARWKTAGSTAGSTGVEPAVLPPVLPMPEQRRAEQSRAEAPARPLIAKRNLRAAFEHPRFDVPDWWHEEKAKGLADGESRLSRFYRWLSERVERTGEDTEPRKTWLNRCFAAWLAEQAPASGIPSVEETRARMAAIKARAGQ